MTFWIIQGLGIFALVFYVISFQMKTKEKLLIIQVISNVFSTIQYILAMAMTGAIQTALGVLRGIVFCFYKKHNLYPNKIVLLIFELAIILGTIFTWDGMLCLLPLIAMSANLYGQWQDDMKWVRILAIFSATLWLIYAFYTEVYSGMLVEAFKIISSSVGLWRYRKSDI